MNEWWHTRVAAFGAPFDPNDIVSSNGTRPVTLPGELTQEINKHISVNERWIHANQMHPYRIDDEGFMGVYEDIIDVRASSRTAPRALSGREAMAR
jgi:hypothetical protein